MRMSTPIARLAAWGGVAGAALLWAINLELGQILPYSDCVQEARMSALASAAALILACVFGALSLLAARAHIRGFASPRTIRFVAIMSALSALIFAFALAMQTIASVVISGCER
jgi:hypothetical protein